MTVILEMRRAHQHLTTYLFNSIYVELIAILIKLDGFACSQSLPKLFDIPIFWLWGYLMTVIQEMGRVH